MPVQPSATFGSVQTAADQAASPVTTGTAIRQKLVVIMSNRIAVAASPNQLHPGNSTPAAVIGLAQPMIPNGGRLIRTLAIRYRSIRGHPDRPDHSVE
ncbi:hypothetical protein [Labrenzia sp. MBR-25]